MGDSIVVFSFMKYQFGTPVNPLIEYITSLVMFLAVIVLARIVKKDMDSVLPINYQASLGSVPMISIGIIFYVIKLGTQFRNIILFTATGLLVINILNVYIYQSLVQFYSAYMEQKMQEQILHVYADELEVMQETQKRENTLWHDMKHHIIELKTMLNLNYSRNSI